MLIFLIKVYCIAERQKYNETTLIIILWTEVEKLSKTVTKLKKFRNGSLFLNFSTDWVEWAYGTI